MVLFRKCYSLLIFLAIVTMLSCGTRKGYFSIEGRFLHINQGELYVYSPDGGIDGIDTIRIQAGRFAYETPLKRPSTLMLVFPNFSEHPVFAESGKSVDIKADASRLKEMTVKGTDENELMNSFREQIASASPPEERKYAEQFIKDHPESRIGLYLLRKYFLSSTFTDYKKAKSLAKVMADAQPEEVGIALLHQRLASYTLLLPCKPLAAFKSKDTYGKTVGNSNVNKGTAYINVWASWDSESMELQRTINKDVKDGKVKAIGICLDPDKNACNKTIERDDIVFPNICDGKMLESPLLEKIGIGTVPCCIKLQNGKISDVNISLSKMKTINASNSQVTIR